MIDREWLIQSRAMPKAFSLTQNSAKLQRKRLFHDMYLCSFFLFRLQGPRKKRGSSRVVCSSKPGVLKTLRYSTSPRSAPELFSVSITWCYIEPWFRPLHHRQSFTLWKMWKDSISSKIGEQSKREEWNHWQPTTLSKVYLISDRLI